jgi:hypothetical protein
MDTRFFAILVNKRFALEWLANNLKKPDVNGIVYYRLDGQYQSIAVFIIYVLNLYFPE